MEVVLKGVPTVFIDESTVYHMSVFLHVGVYAMHAHVWHVEGHSNIACNVPVHVHVRGKQLFHCSYKANIVTIAFVSLHS